MFGRQKPQPLADAERRLGAIHCVEVNAWCAGGEETFIRRMIRESTAYSAQVEWFTSLVAKKNRLDAILKEIKGAGATDVRVIDMDQGQKTSRIVAWHF